MEEDKYVSLANREWFSIDVMKWSTFRLHSFWHSFRKLQLWISLSSFEIHGVSQCRVYNFLICYKYSICCYTGLFHWSSWSTLQVEQIRNDGVFHIRNVGENSIFHFWKYFCYKNKTFFKDNIFFHEGCLVEKRYLSHGEKEKCICFTEYL